MHLTRLVMFKSSNVRRFSNSFICLCLGTMVTSKKTTSFQVVLHQLFVPCTSWILNSIELQWNIGMEVIKVLNIDQQKFKPTWITILEPPNIDALLLERLKTFSSFAFKNFYTCKWLFYNSWWHYTHFSFLNILKPLLGMVIS
jgi:hypothetical protein